MVGLRDDGWKAVFANHGGFKPPLHEEVLRAESFSSLSHPDPCSSAFIRGFFGEEPDERGRSSLPFGEGLLRVGRLL